MNVSLSGSGAGGSVLREPVLEDPGAERERLLEDLATGYRLFAAMRWGDLGDGHITVRDPERADHMWLLAHEVPYHRAEAGHMVLVRPDGTATDQQGRPASINITAHYIHHPIHQSRPEVGAAAHVHTPWGTPFAAERRGFEMICQEAALFFEDHALFDDEEVQVLSIDGGKRIAAALGDNRGAILANHGLLTVGATPADAVGWFLFMERVCEIHMKARQAKPISDEAARIAHEDLTKGDLGWSIFWWAAKRHLNLDQPPPTP